MKSGSCYACFGLKPLDQTDTTATYCPIHLFLPSMADYLITTGFWLKTEILQLKIDLGKAAHFRLVILITKPTQRTIWFHLTLQKAARAAAREKGAVLNPTAPSAAQTGGVDPPLGCRNRYGMGTVG